VARLVLLTLAAAGFIAMHGVAATDAAGRHHSPTSLAAVAGHEDSMSHDASGVAASPLQCTDECPDHGMVAGCVFVLLSALTGIALHALYGRLGAMPSALLRCLVPGRRRSRAPPRPIFLSLCVFRL
jgi:hypothetical protein